MSNYTKQPVSRIGKNFSDRAERVADIILDNNCAGKTVKTKQISKETASMLKDVKRIVVLNFLHYTAYGTGKFLSLAKHTYCSISNYLKEKVRR